MSAFSKKDLLGIKDLTKEEILFFLESADNFVEVNERSLKKVPALRGKTVINLFFEPSTRTRMSFELAAKRLSADAINFSASQSSQKKGETFLDTALNIQAMSPDVVVVRHPESGALNLLKKHLSNTSIVNAGDGLHEHPTQALLDALAIKRKLGKLDNLKICFVGDGLRSRVFRSDFYLFKSFGCEVRLVSPPTLALKEFKALGVKTFSKLEEGLKDADVVVSLRMKHEYQKDHYIPSLDEYAEHYCITEALLSKHAPNSIVLAPGPIIRGIEISTEVADGPRSLIQEQVGLGLAVRMAVLFELASKKTDMQKTDSKNSHSLNDGASNE